MSKDSRPFRTSHWVHGVYAVAMLGTALATFGYGGLVLAAMILPTWRWLFLRVSRANAFFVVLLGWLVVGFPSYVAVQAIHAARERDSRAACPSRLKLIAWALWRYQDDHGTLPPAYVADEEGRPMHSWRVLILPYLDEEELYSQYCFDEPWNGPNNRKLAAPMPWVYACPHDPRASLYNNTMTSYFAVVGPTTAWPGARGRDIRSRSPDVLLRNTILILESHSQTAHWMEPWDLDRDTAIRLLTTADPFDDTHVIRGFFYDRRSIRRFARADGDVWAPPPMISREAAESLLDIDQDDVSEPEGFYGAIVRPNHDNWFWLGMFSVLTVVPLLWMSREPKRQHSD